MTGLVVMVLKEGTLLPEDAEMVPLNYKPWLSPGHFRHIVTKDYQTRKGVTTMARVINADHHEEVGLQQGGMCMLLR